MTDTAVKRASALNVSMPWRGMYPLPDGEISKLDRRMIPFLYQNGIPFLYQNGVFNITSRAVLHDPVDCVLAGEQAQIHTGRLSRGSLKHAFGE